MTFKWYSRTLKYLRVFWSIYRIKRIVCIKILQENSQNKTREWGELQLPRISRQAGSR